MHAVYHNAMYHYINVVCPSICQFCLVCDVELLCSYRWLGYFKSNYTLLSPEIGNLVQQEHTQFFGTIACEGVS